MQKLLYLLLMLSSTIVMGGCNGNRANTASKTAKDSAAPVPTGKANTNYKPAFDGQTRIRAVHTNTPVEVTRLAKDLEFPWAIIPFSKNRFLISHRTGYLSIYGLDGKLQNKITGLPKVDDRGQGGLLDVALDPAFEQNHTIYWSFSEKYGVGNLTAVAKGELSADEKQILHPQVIFRATPALESQYHYGSRLQFDKEGYLFVSTGERSKLEGRKQSQWLNAGLGKIFRITKDGQPAPDNPFLKDPNAMPAIYSYGHRNPQSLAIHPVTGELWEAEFGPRGGDELNLIKPGKNYGWPIITYGIEYDGPKIGEGIQQKEGMEQPVYYWDPVLSPSGMTFYSSDSIPEWKNNLFIGGLSSTHIARLVIENNRVVGEENLLQDQNERIRDVTEWNGALYAVSDGGILFRIAKK